MRMLALMRTLLSNCGGRNRKVSRYAGRLSGDVSEREFIEICHCLIFQNGTRKTTDRNRNVGLIENKLSTHVRSLVGQIDVLDVGSSIGLDSIATIEWLSRRTAIRAYILGDLYTEILVHESGRYVKDQDGRLLQYLSGNSFTSLNFSFQYPVQKLIHYWNYWSVSRERIDSPPGRWKRVPLLLPELRGSSFSFVRLERLDVFDLQKDSFDLIVCMNLLVPRYFTAEQIESGIQSLTGALRPGGLLIVGANDWGRVVRRAGHSRDLEILEEW